MGLEDAPALVARIARMLVLCSVVRVRTTLGLGAWVTTAAGIASRWGGPEEGQVAAALAQGWASVARGTGPALRGRMGIVSFLAAISHASHLGPVPDPWDLEALAGRTGEGVRDLAIAAAWGTYEEQRIGEGAPEAVAAGVEIARWMWLVANLEAELPVQRMADDDPRREAVVGRVVDQIQAGTGAPAVRDRVAVVFVHFNFPGEAPCAEGNGFAEPCAACDGCGICAACDGKTSVWQGFRWRACAECGGFGICAACEGRQVASPPTSRPWWEEGETRDAPAGAARCGVLGPRGLRCELAPGHGGTHHAEPDDDAGEDPQEACDVCGAPPGKNCQDPRSCERERGPRPGEDGQRVAPEPCDRFRPFEAAPGYCWCGWLGYQHGGADEALRRWSCHHDVTPCGAACDPAERSDTPTDPAPPSDDAPGSPRLSEAVGPQPDDGDPRGPYRKVVNVGPEQGQVTLSCGHVRQFNPCCTYRVGQEHRCFACRGGIKGGPR